MLGAYFNAKKIEIDISKYTTDLQNQMNKLLIRAAKAFTKVLQIRIPTYTGRAQGSIAALGEEVGMHWTISPARNSRGVTVPNKFNQGKQESVFGFENTKDKQRFYFRSDVLYVNTNDQVDPIKWGIKLTQNPIPWGVFELAREAADRVLSDGLKEAPKLSKYFKIKSIVRHMPRLKG